MIDDILNTYHQHSSDSQPNLVCMAPVIGKVRTVMGLQEGEMGPVYCGLLYPMNDTIYDGSQAVALYHIYDCPSLVTRLFIRLFRSYELYAVLFTLLVLCVARFYCAYRRRIALSSAVSKWFVADHKAVGRRVQNMHLKTPLLLDPQSTVLMTICLMCLPAVAAVPLEQRSHTGMNIILIPLITIFFQAAYKFVVEYISHPNETTTKKKKEDWHFDVEANRPYTFNAKTMSQELEVDHDEPHELAFHLAEEFEDEEAADSMLRSLMSRLYYESVFSRSPLFEWSANYELATRWYIFLSPIICGFLIAHAGKLLAALAVAVLLFSGWHVFSALALLYLAYDALFCDSKVVELLRIKFLTCRYVSSTVDNSRWAIMARAFHLDYSLIAPVMKNMSKTSWFDPFISMLYEVWLINPKTMAKDETIRVLTVVIKFIYTYVGKEYHVSLLACFLPDEQPFFMALEDPSDFETLTLTSNEALPVPKEIDTDSESTHSTIDDLEVPSTDRVSRLISLTTGITEMAEAMEKTLKDRDINTIMMCAAAVFTAIPCMAGIIAPEQVSKTRQSVANSFVPGFGLAIGGAFALLKLVNRVAWATASADPAATFLGLCTANENDLYHFEKVMSLIQAGLWEAEGVDLSKELGNAARLQEKWEMELTHPKNKGSTKLKNSCMRLTTIIRTIMNELKTTHGRVRPFTLTCSGDPSVGKTNWVNQNAYLLGNMLGHSHPYISHRQQTKFDEQVRLGTNVVVCHDIDQVDIKYREIPVASLLMTLNESGSREINRAAAEEKGISVYNHDGLMMTMNKDFLIHEGKDNEAILRRLGHFFYFDIRKDCKKEDGGFDVEKVKKLPAGVTPYLFRMGKLLDDGSGEIRFHPAGDWMDEKEFWIVVRHLIEEWKNTKKFSQANVQSKSTICLHGYPNKTCHHCKNGNLFMPVSTPEEDYEDVLQNRSIPSDWELKIQVTADKDLADQVAQEKGEECSKTDQRTRVENRYSPAVSNNSVPHRYNAPIKQGWAPKWPKKTGRKRVAKTMAAESGGFLANTYALCTVVICNYKGGTEFLRGLLGISYAEARNTYRNGAGLGLFALMVQLYLIAAFSFGSVYCLVATLLASAFMFASYVVTTAAHKVIPKALMKDYEQHWEELTQWENSNLRRWFSNPFKSRSRKISAEDCLLIASGVLSLTVLATEWCKWRSKHRAVCMDLRQEETTPTPPVEVTKAVQDDKVIETDIAPRAAPEVPEVEDVTTLHSYNTTGTERMAMVGKAVHVVNTGKTWEALAVSPVPNLDESARTGTREHVVGKLHKNTFAITLTFTLNGGVEKVVRGHGFKITPSLLVTNKHFFESSKTNAPMDIDHFQIEMRGSQPGKTYSNLKANRFFLSPDRDLAFVLIVGGTTCPDLRRLLSKTHDPSNRSGEYLFYDKDGKYVRSALTSCQAEVSTSLDHGSVTKVRPASQSLIDSMPKNGDCGCPVISDKDGKECFILGLFTAGDDKKPVSSMTGVEYYAVWHTRISLADLEEAERNFIATTEYVGELIQAPLTGENAKGDRIEYGKDPHVRSWANWTTENGELLTSIHGIADRNSSSRSSMVCNSMGPYYKESGLAVPTHAPAVMNYNKSMHAIAPFLAGHAQDFDWDVMDRAIDLFLEPMKENLAAIKESLKEKGLDCSKPFSMDQALNGIDDTSFDSMKLATSGGDGTKKRDYVHYNPNDGNYVLKEDFAHKYQEAEANVIMGLGTESIGQILLKDEARKVEETGDKQRVARAFCVPSFIHYLMARRILGPLATVVTMNPDIFHTAIGTDNMGGDCSQRYSRMFEEGFENYAFDADYKKQDVTQGRSVRQAAIRLWMRIADLLDWDQPDKDLLLGLLKDLLDSKVNAGGIIMQLTNFFLSGIFITAVDNGFRTVLLVLYTLIKCADEKGVPVNKDWVLVKSFLTSLGDDLMGAMHEDLVKITGWSPARMKEILDLHGVIMTGSDKSLIPTFKHASQAEFLSSHFAHNPELEKTYLTHGFESVLKSCFYMSDSIEGSKVRNEKLCDTMLMEATYSGRAMYDWIQKGGTYVLPNGVEHTSKGVLWAFEKAGYIPTPAMLLSYDESIACRKAVEAQKYPECGPLHLKGVTDNIFSFYIERYLSAPRYIPTEGPWVVPQLGAVEHKPVTMSDMDEDTGAMPVSEAPLVTSTETIGASLHPQVAHAPIMEMATVHASSLTTYPMREIMLNGVPLRPGENTISVFNPLRLILDHPAIAEKLAGYPTIAADIELTFSWQEPKGCAGCLMVSYMHRPDINVTEESWTHKTAIARQSMRPHLWINIGEGNQKATMTIPFTCPEPMLPLDDASIDTYVLVQITPMVSLYNATGSSAPMTLHIRAALRNVKLGPAIEARFMSDEEVAVSTGEKFSSRLIGFSRVLSQLSNFLSPYSATMGLASEAASHTVGGAGGLLSLAGLSIPEDQTAAPAVPVLASHMANSDGERAIATLSLFAKQETPRFAPAHGIELNDPMSFEFLKSIDTFCGSYSISSKDDVAGNTVFQFPVSPAFLVAEGSPIYPPTGRIIVPGCGIPAMFTRYWRGDMEYTFTAIMSSMTCCTLMFQFDAYPDEALYAIHKYQEAVTTNQTHIVTFDTQNREVKIVVHYCSHRNMLETYIARGEDGGIRNMCESFDSRRDTGAITVTCLQKPNEIGDNEGIVWLRMSAKAAPNMQYFDECDLVSRYLEIKEAVPPKPMASTHLCEFPHTVPMVSLDACVGTDEPFSEPNAIDAFAPMVGIVQPTGDSNGENPGPFPYPAPPPIDDEDATTVPVTNQPTAAPTTTAPATAAPTTASTLLSWVTGAPTVASTIGPTLPPVAPTSAPTVAVSTASPTAAPTPNCTVVSSTQGMIVDSYTSDAGNRADPNHFVFSKLGGYYTPTQERMRCGTATPCRIESYTYVGPTGSTIVFQLASKFDDAYTGNVSNITGVKNGCTISYNSSNHTISAVVAAGQPQGFQTVYFTAVFSAACNITSIQNDMPEGVSLDYQYADELILQNQPGAPGAIIVPTTDAVNTTPYNVLSVPAGEYFVVPKEPLPCTDTQGFAIVVYLNNLSVGASPTEFGISLTTLNSSYLWSNAQKSSRLFNVPDTGLHLIPGNNAPLLIYCIIRPRPAGTMMSEEDVATPAAQSYVSSMKKSPDHVYSTLICPEAGEASKHVTIVDLNAWIEEGHRINWSLRFARLPGSRHYVMDGDIGTPLYQIVLTKPNFIIGTTFSADCLEDGNCYTRMGRSAGAKARLLVLGKNPTLRDVFTSDVFHELIDAGEIDLMTVYNLNGDHYGTPLDAEEEVFPVALLMLDRDTWDCTIGSSPSRTITFNDPSSYDMAACIHFGQHIVSLRPLASRMGDCVEVTGRTTQQNEGGLSRASYRANQYRPIDVPDSVWVPTQGAPHATFGEMKMSAKNFMLRSCLAIRGGHLVQLLVRTVHGESVTVEVKQSPDANPQLAPGNTTQTGVAMADTRVNPLLIVKLPYRENQTFIYARTLTGEPMCTNQRITTVTSFGPTDFSIQEWSAIADDQQYLNFLGSVPLQRIT